MAVTADLTATGSARPSPRAVLFDATGSRSSTEDTRIKAYHHLLYFMDFGDPSSGDWGDGDYGHAGAIAGMPRNEHFGPIGAHVYEVADGAGDQVFTAIVYATDGVTVDSAEQSITVYDPNGANGYSSTLCVENIATGSGGPSGATYLTSADYDAALNTTANVDNQGGAATHTRILFRRGDTFTASTSASFQVNGPIHVGAFGTGAAPRVEMTGNTITNLIGDYNENLTLTNYSFADLEIDGNSGSGAMGFSAYEGFTGLLILRCDVHHCLNGAQFSASFLSAHDSVAEKAIYNQLFIVDSSIRDGAGGGGGNLVFAAAKNFAILGSLLSNSASVEHVFRTGYVNPGVFAYSYMTTPASAKHVIKMHCADGNAAIATAGGITQFAYLHNNRFKGATGCAWVIALGPQSADTGGADSAEQVHDVLVDGCWFEPEAATQRPLLCWADRVTARNNLIDTSGNLSHVGIEIAVRDAEGAHDDCEVYNNTFYSSTTGNFLPVYINTGTGHLVRNNFGWAPNATSTQDMVSGSGSWTESNNSTLAQMDAATNTGTNGPFFAGSNGDGTGTFSNPSDFFPIAGSYALAGGTAVNNLADVQLRSRIGVTNDMGFYQVTEGEYSWVDSAPAATVGGAWRSRL